MYEYRQVKILIPTREIFGRYLLFPATSVIHMDMRHADRALLAALLYSQFWS